VVSAQGRVVQGVNQQCIRLLGDVYRTIRSPSGEHLGREFGI
jgi:hypothetical protein